MNIKNTSLLFILLLPLCCISLNLFAIKEGSGLKYSPYPLSTKNLTCKASGAYTYWAPYQEGLNIAYYKGSKTVVGDTIQPDFPCRSGFKVLIGGTIEHRNLDVLLGYTWFSTAPKSTSAILIQDASYQTPFDASFTLKEITSAFLDQFNRVNGLMEVNLYHTSRTILQANYGCIVTWDFQRLTMSSQSAVSDDQTLKSNFSQNWYAVGPYFSLCPTFSIVNHLELFFNGGTSILLSKRKTTQTQWVSDTSTDTNTPSMDYTSILFGVEPMVDANLGIRSDWILNDWSIAFEISWEIQTYFSHNSFQGAYPSTGPMGCYTMQGLTANFIMDF